MREKRSLEEIAKNILIELKNIRYKYELKRYNIFDKISYIIFSYIISWDDIEKGHIRSLI